jgi:hypothetical protein
VKYDKLECDSTRYVALVVRDVYHIMITISPGNRAKTGVLNSIVFHKIPTVEFDFTAISIVVWGRG